MPCRLMRLHRENVKNKKNAENGTLFSHITCCVMVPHYNLTPPPPPTPPATKINSLLSPMLKGIYWLPCFSTHCDAHHLQYTHFTVVYQSRPTQNFERYARNSIGPREEFLTYVTSHRNLYRMLKFHDFGKQFAIFIF